MSTQTEAAWMGRARDAPGSGLPEIGDGEKHMKHAWMWVGLSLSLALMNSALGFSGDEAAAEAASGAQASTTASRLGSDGGRPVQVYDRDWIEASGQFSLAELLRDLPLNVSGSERAYLNLLTHEPVLASAELRGLPAGYTRVLVDGQRWPLDPHSGQAVNLLTLPLAMIERIEVLPEGAAAVHGAGAVGGVINLVTRSGFEGSEIALGASAPNDRGGERREASALFGTHWAGGKLLVGVGHDQREALHEYDLPAQAFPGLSLFGNNFLFDSADGPQRVPNGAGCRGRGFELLQLADGTRYCAYDQRLDVQRNMASDNRSLFSRATFEMGSDKVLSVAATITRTRLRGQGWPSHVFTRNVAGIGLPALPPGSPNHPSTPPEEGGLNPDWNEFDALSSEPVFIEHSFAANGPIQRIETTDASRLDLALVQRIGPVTLDLGAGYNNARLDAEGTNSLLLPAAHEALLDGRYNLYDIGDVPPSVLEGMEADLRSRSRWQDWHLRAAARGSFVNLSGGPVRLGIGVEWREEQLEIRPTTASINTRYELLPRLNRMQAERDVWSLFSEAEAPWGERLQSQLALRWDRADDLGTVLNARASTRWTLNEAFSVRAAWTRSGQPPLLGQGLQFPVEPDLVVPALPQSQALCDYLGLDLTDCRYRIESRTTRNPALRYEIAHQWSIGLRADLGPQLSISVDAFDLDLTGRARRLGPAGIVDCFFGVAIRCPDQSIALINAGQDFPEEGLAVLIQPIDPDQSVLNEVAWIFVQNGLVNGGRAERRGIDLQVDSRWANDWLDLASTLRASWLDRASDNSSSDLVGLPGVPEWRGQWFTRARFRDLTLSWVVNHIASQRRRSRTELPSWTTHDVQLAWDSPWNGHVSLGVDNLADRRQPYAGLINGPRLYDDYGRIAWLRYRQRF